MKSTSGKSRNQILVIGLFFVLGGVFCNEKTIALLFSGGKEIESIVCRLLLYVFNLLALSIGIMTIVTRSKQRLFRYILRAFVLQMAILAFFLGAEVYLRFQERAREETHPRFAQQYLHPFYYFFFPRDQKTIDQMNDDSVSIDINGFRGDGPEKRNGKKLAFIVGGSAAFGEGSSSNQTTISGYLNTIQPEYHFVNAGVPSWNSTQEFFRVSLQLVAYNPSLIIAYDGYNDVLMSLRNKSFGYPPGTPESYHHLEKWVDDIRAEKPVGPFLIYPHYRLEVFQQTNTYLMKVFPVLFSIDDRPPRDSMPASSHSLRQEVAPSPHYHQRSAQWYLRNLELMDKVCKSYGCRFVAIWQPSVSQHKNLPYSRGEEDAAPAVRLFRDYIFKEGKYSFDLFGFGDIFDQYDGEIQSEGEVFQDYVHSTDKGNEIVAGEIVKVLEEKGLILAEKDSHEQLKK